MTIHIISVCMSTPGLDSIIPKPRGKLVLSVDDDSVNQTVIEFLLTSNGYQVVAAMDGIEALEYMKKNTLPDMILLDVMMPHLSGYEVCVRLRDLYPASIPIIMISAKSSSDDILQGLKCGANDYVTKPFDRDELLARIDCHIRLNELRVSQEKENCYEALKKVAIPKFLNTQQSNFKNVLLCGIKCTENKQFIEYLSKQFDFSKIPTRFDDLYLCMSFEDEGLCDPGDFVTSLNDHYDHSISIYLSRGTCSGTIIDVDTNIPSFTMYGDAIDNLNRMISLGLVDDVLVTNFKVEIFPIFQKIYDFYVMPLSDNPVASSPAGRNAELGLKQLHSKGARCNRILDQLERLVKDSKSKRRCESFQEELRNIITTDFSRNQVDEFLTRFIDTANEGDTSRELIDKEITKFLSPDQMASIEPLIQEIEKLKLIEKLSVDEYREISSRTNSELKSCLATESLNEMLYLEIQRNQFERKPPKLTNDPLLSPTISGKYIHLLDS